MLLAAAVLDAPDDPSGRGLVMVVAAVLVLALVTLHVRLLLRVAPRDAAVARSADRADHQPDDERTDDEPNVDAGSSEGRSASAPFPAAPAPAPPPREPVDARLS